MYLCALGCMHTGFLNWSTFAVHIIFSKLQITNVLCKWTSLPSADKVFLGRRKTCINVIEGKQPKYPISLFPFKWISLTNDQLGKKGKWRAKTGKNFLSFTPNIHTTSNQYMYTYLCSYSTSYRVCFWLLVTKAKNSCCQRWILCKLQCNFVNYARIGHDDNIIVLLCTFLLLIIVEMCECATVRSQYSLYALISYSWYCRAVWL